jgi:mono/diheme cytochrome c family protein
MSDDKANIGVRDRERINLNERYEVDYWTGELGVTEEVLREAVAAVGVSVARVREYLGSGVAIACAPAAARRAAAGHRCQRAAMYEGNAYQISEGQRYYEWFNCSGCHAHGGGDIGPALMDDEWRYGGAITQIRASIADGRPNGMPAFGDKIPDEQLWQIAAYVRSMSGNADKLAASSRDDHMRTTRRTTRPSPGLNACRRRPARWERRGEAPGISFWRCCCWRAAAASSRAGSGRRPGGAHEVLWRLMLWVCGFMYLLVLGSWRRRSGRRATAWPDRRSARARRAPGATAAARR